MWKGCSEHGTGGSLVRDEIFERGGFGAGLGMIEGQEGREMYWECGWLLNNQMLCVV